uniref:Uncharacterized protein n=1 Tax=Arundo donax TaxID=35708 RepID=A0A0A9CQ16_ARUDO
MRTNYCGCNNMFLGHCIFHLTFKVCLCEICGIWILCENGGLSYACSDHLCEHASFVVYAAYCPLASLKS